MSNLRKMTKQTLVIMMHYLNNALGSYRTCLYLAQKKVLVGSSSSKWRDQLCLRLSMRSCCTLTYKLFTSELLTCSQIALKMKMDLSWLRDTMKIFLMKMIQYLKEYKTLLQSACKIKIVKILRKNQIHVR